MTPSSTIHIRSDTAKRAARIIGALLCLGVSSQPVLAAEAFEAIEKAPTSEVLPRSFLRSANYEIDPVSHAKDNFYYFEVLTDHGNYKIASLSMLRLRLHEISTVSEISARLNQSGVNLNRSPGGRRGVASEFVVDILSDPISTASQLLGNIQYNLEETFIESKRGDPSGARRSAGTDLNPGPHRRSAAAQVGVDVYSSNPALQELLDRIEKSRSAGTTTTAISPLVRNVFAGPAFGTGEFNARMLSLLKNMGSEALNDLIASKLKNIGVPASVRIAFVTQPAFTPRTRLFFTAYLELLSDVSDVDRLVAAATSARTEVDALAYVNYLRMLAFYQLSSGDLVEVVTESRFPTLATSSRKAVLALPLDYLAWSEPVSQAAVALQELRASKALESLTVLLAGSPTERARAELADRGVKVHARYSF